MKKWTPWTKGAPECECGRAAATHRHKGRSVPWDGGVSGVSCGGYVPTPPDPVTDPLVMEQPVENDHFHSTGEVCPTCDRGVVLKSQGAHSGKA